MTSIGLLFPGQGSQYSGMGTELTVKHAIARQTFEEASDALGWNVLRLCTEGDAERLKETSNAQPAILTHSVATYRVLMAQGIYDPVIGGGHSLGEFSALACSGALMFADAVRLVHKRGLWMQSAASREPGGMAAAIGVDEDRLGELLAAVSDDHAALVVAGINGRSQRIVSGGTAALRKLEQRMSAMPAARLILLNVGGAFHSPAMKEASALLKEELEATAFHAPSWPVLSNVTGQPHGGDKEQWISLLTRQLTEPVQWLRCMEHVRSARPAMLAEAGPGRVLTGLWQSFAPEIRIVTADDLLAAAQPDNATSANFLFRCLGVAVATKNGNDDPVAYRTGVVEPYRRIEALARELRDAGATPTEEQIRQGWRMLLTIFEAKGTDSAERRSRLSALARETGTERWLAETESIKGGVAK